MAIEINDNENEQPDDHCRLTFLYEDWWIAAVRGHLILLTNSNGQKILNVANVDWGAYEREAVRWLNEVREVDEWLDNL